MAVEDSVAQDQLRAFIERIERMEEEKAAIAADIKEIYVEAKGNGFDTKILRKIVAIRKQDANERMEQEAILELYMDALGMQLAHDRAMHDRLSGGRSAPLFAGPIESISEPITEQQVAPQPASDLTKSPSPQTQGQVAPIPAAVEAQRATPVDDVDGSGEANQPETADECSTARADNASELTDETGLRVEVLEAGKSVEASASAAPRYTDPGKVTTEHTPPEPVKWHPYAQCFPTVLGDDLKALERDIHAAFGGVQQPIVKIGNLILDGRARCGIARSMMIDYPVVQYAGTDPLLDLIAMNLNSRSDRMTSAQVQATAKALCKLEPTRADDIMQAFGLEIAEAAE